MKASEIIKQLQKTIKENGDLEVLHYNDCNDEYRVFNTISTETVGQGGYQTLVDGFERDDKFIGFEWLD